MIPRPPISTLFPYTTLFRSFNNAFYAVSERLRQAQPDSQFKPLVFIKTKKADNRVIITVRSEEHTSELQSPVHLVCRLLLEKKKKQRLLTILYSTNYNILFL